MNPSLPDSMHQHINKMKGDAIGDTMYSERWVLKTLMKLSQEYSDYCNPDDYHLECGLEEDLGLLWDMTIEPDVASFLMENNAVELITDVITFSCSPRMNEIMIGILGNLACQEHIRQKISTNNDLIQVIINQLISSDSPTLIQVVRLINTCIWNLSDKSLEKLDASDKKEDKTSWISCLNTEKELLHKSLCFILTSSRNEDLLRATLGMMESLFNMTTAEDDYFCKHFSTEDFVKALMEAIKEMSNHVDDGNNSLLCNNKLKQGIEHWVSLLHRLASHDVGVIALEKHADEVISVVNSVWVEQSARCDYFERNHVSHLVLALEVLRTLLPYQSTCYNVGNALALLDLVSNSGKDYSGKGDLKETLEEFCFLVVKQWRLKSESLIDDLKCYSEQEIDMLWKVLEQKLNETRISSFDCVNLKITELKTLIESLSTEM